MSLPKVTSSTPPLDGKGKKNQKAVLLFSASWHEGCGPVEAVLAALAASADPQDDVYMANIDAEEVSEWADRYNVTAVPTVLFLQGDTIVERLEQSVQPANMTVAFQKLLLSTTAHENHHSTMTTTTLSEGASAPSLVAVDPETALNRRLHQLIRSDTVMVFMKGIPTAPRCGFSRQVVEILQEHGVPFGSFDILMDETVRQGLKTFSDWPTYPQIYVNGELQGGLDILKELAEQGNLAQQFNVAKAAVTPPVPTSLNDTLSQLVNRSHVMLFMKGLPSAPKCGFSRQLVAILDEVGVPYDAFDILQDEQVRQGLKTYSNWPTFPQLYVKGELVGGLDICEELQESGDLLETLQQ